MTRWGHDRPRGSLWWLRGLATGAMLAATLLPMWGGGGTVRAATTWAVQVGGMGPNGAALNGYFPDPLTIMVGDTVTWNFSLQGEPHTVTFNSGKEPLADFLPGPGPGELTLGPSVFPLGPQGPTATYNGTEQLSSGLPLGPNASPTYSLTFTKPGVYAFVCTIHDGMRGQVTVVPSTIPLAETPAQATARGQVTAAYLLSRIPAAAQHVRSATIGPVHTVAAGIGDGYGVSALAFLPGTVTVKRGDTVVWTFADPQEIHTVTFTSGALPPDFIEPRPQPSGPPIFVVPANVAGPTGGQSYTGTGIVNSGIVEAGNAFGLTFDVPPGSYPYLCILHPGMTGTIVVSP